MLTAYPELLKGESGWKVLPGKSPSVNLIKKEIYLPRDANTHSIAHELTHILESPRRTPDGFVEQVVEDSAINSWLSARLGIGPIGLEQNDFSVEDIKKNISKLKRSGEDLAFGIALSLGLEDYSFLTPILGEKCVRLLNVIQEPLLPTEELKICPREDRKQIKDLVTQLFPTLTRYDSGFPLSYFISSNPEQSKTQETKYGFGLAIARGYGTYADMLLIEPSLNKKVPTNPNLKKKSLRDTGLIPRNFDRIATGQIFKNNGISAYTSGGTLLIDASGSMRLDSSQVEVLARKFCYGLVAVYSGPYVTESVTGALVVIARNGRILDPFIREDFFSGGQNAIDGPAIDWLLRQRGPRYYVGDLEFTGRNDLKVVSTLWMDTYKKLNSGKVIIVSASSDILSFMSEEVRPPIVTPPNSKENQRLYIATKAGTDKLEECLQSLGLTV